VHSRVPQATSVWAVPNCLGDVEVPPIEILPKEQTAALQALQMDQNSSDTHVLLAHTKLEYDWDWVGAEKEYRRAIELNPNSSEAHLYYAWFLDSMGGMQEGENEHLLAQEVDPFNEVMNEAFYHSRQVDKAIQVLRKSVEVDPNSGLNWQLGILYEAKGTHDERVAPSSYRQGISHAQWLDIPSIQR
jgi:Tfp pilus assembly protein PilF